MTTTPDIEAVRQRLANAAITGGMKNVRPAVDAALEVMDHLQDTITALQTRVDEAEAILRNVISHASGGHITGEGMSLNDICVRISRHHNRVYEGGKESGAKEFAAAQADVARVTKERDELRLTLEHRQREHETDIPDLNTVHTAVREGWKADALEYKAQLATLRAVIAKIDWLRLACGVEDAGRQDFPKPWDERTAADYLKREMMSALRNLDQPESEGKARKIEDHPCYWSLSGKLGHRRPWNDVDPAPCERCGTLIDKQHKEVGPVQWPTQPEGEDALVDLIRDQMMSGDYPVSEWEIQFAAKIRALPEFAKEPRA